MWERKQSGYLLYVYILHVAVVLLSRTSVGELK
jgi:hypothetical protein